MRTQTLHDGAESFIVSVHEAAENSPVVLFAVGAGGQPERHATLLNVLAESGCTVVAPHFDRLTLPTPTEADLTLRARRLSLTLDAVEVRVTAGADHFSFMDLPPPQTMEPLPDKQAFLREYSSEVCKFVSG